MIDKIVLLSSERQTEGGRVMRGCVRKDKAASSRIGGRGRTATARASLPFNRKLVLNQWLLGLFEVERLDELAEY